MLSQFRLTCLHYMLNMIKMLITNKVKSSLTIMIKLGGTGKPFALILKATLFRLIWRQTMAYL